ncbi:polysaccharide biosynthesis/export family protein [Shimia biformata]|uniref:polysaccharide biosynthesis/export family protein n=1 Tax=Shimia biformata TaxID=1294299 RepID=UPI001952857E|nr:polysaccharide biosynthesis/export family protein [Shimia biformata]
MASKAGANTGVKNGLIRLTAVLCLLVASACSLPRGAPTAPEVLNNGLEKDESVAVIPITRENLKAISQWPPTGWHGHYHWLQATRGPESNVIRTGDKIGLRVWDNQDNSLLTSAVGKNAEILRLEVSNTGTIFVPYIDRVAVRGLTPDQARELIQNRLAEIAPSAQVVLEHVPGVANSVSLVGGVRNPGSYPLPNRNFSIMSLLAMAGGISPELDNPLVRLVRDGQTYEIRAYQLFEDNRKNVILRGGDQVILDEDKRFFIAIGATQDERPVAFEKEQITAMEAMALIGGLLDTHANPKGLFILREYEPDQLSATGQGPERPYVIFTLDLTTADGLFAARKFQIHPNDTVLATESVLKPVQAIIALFGSAFALANAAS